MLLNQKKVGMASDHAGFELKEYIRKNLIKMGYEIMDFGTHSNESTDYPYFAHLLGNAINSKELSRGIGICGSGQGMSITLNKYPEVRAALCWNEEIARLARLHNDANVLALPGRFIGPDEALQVVLSFLKTDFEGGRHQKRVDKIKI